MERVNLANWTELLHHGSGMGYDWNTLHNYIARESCFLPEDGDGSTSWHIADLEECDIHPDAMKVMKSYYEKHNVEEITWTL